MHKATEENVVNDLCEAFENSCAPLAQQLEPFARNVRSQDLARFLVRYVIFKLNLGVHGSVVECGVFAGLKLGPLCRFASDSYISYLVK